MVKLESIYIKAIKIKDIKTLQKAPFSTLIELTTRDFGENINKWFLETGLVREVSLVENFVLKPHQILAIDWMYSIENNHSRISKVSDGSVQGGILSLEKGLGKTMTSLILSLASPKKGFPTLVVCKKMFMWDTWRKEIETKFDPPLRVIYLHKDHLTEEEINSLTIGDFRKADLVITTYEFCIKVMKLFPEYENQLYRVLDQEKRFGGKPNINLRTIAHTNPKNKKGPRLVYEICWGRVICDESQNFVTDTSKIFKAVMGLVSEPGKRWCLTGSMVKNYDSDILSQLRFLGYTTITSNGEWKKMGKAYFENEKLGQRIYKVSYSEAGIEMPYKIEENVMVELKGNFRIIYDLIESKLRESNKRNLRFSQLSLLTRIRQTLVSPYLLTKKAKRDRSSNEIDEVNKFVGTHLEKILSPKVRKWCLDITKSGWEAPKIIKAVEIIMKMILEKRKTIVFSTQVMALDVLASKLDHLKISYLVIDGSVPTKLRTERLDSFRSPRGPNVLLASYKVCSESLNISEASCAILLDLWWNNATRDQAIARLWRMGQKQIVNVFVLFSNNTLDQRIEDVCNQKEIISSKYSTVNKAARTVSVIQTLLKT